MISIPPLISPPPLVKAKKTIFQKREFSTFSKIPYYGWFFKMNTVVSRQNPQGVGFIFASLKMNQEKIPLLQIDFHWLWVNSAAKTKFKVWNLRKPPGGGVFIFASPAEKNRKKTPPPWGFSRETPVISGRSYRKNDPVSRKLC